MKKIKIFFLLPSMRGGGAERVGSILVNNLDKDKFDVWLVLVKKEGQYLKDISSDINMIDLDAKSAKSAMPKIIKLLWKEKPDILFSIAGHINLLIAIFMFLMPSKMKFIARETGIVSIRHQPYKYKKIFDYLYSTFYNNFTTIVAQSQHMKDDLVKNFDIKNESIRVINNPVDADTIASSIDAAKKEPLLKTDKVNLLAVGGLRKVKGYDLLLQSMSSLDDRYHLSILGEGAERDNLTQMIETLKLEDKVTLLGFKDKPVLYMAQADLLVMSSRHEGFPNVIIEANACGLPVVAFNCPGGISEIVEENLNGWLIEGFSPQNLAQKIEEVSSRDNDKINIQQVTKDRFALPIIMAQYETLISSTLEESS